MRSPNWHQFKLPGVDFIRPGRVTEAGSAEPNLAAWGAAHTAVRELDGIAGVIGMLVAIGRVDFGCLVGGPLTAPQYDELVRLGLQRVTWSPAMIGVPLNLADAATLRERSVDLETDRARLAIAGQRKGGFLWAF